MNDDFALASALAQEAAVLENPFEWSDYPGIKPRFDATRLQNMLTENACHFDGSNWLSVDQAVATAYPITMCCWFRTNSAPSEQCLMFVGDKDSYRDYTALQLVSDDVRLTRRNSGGVDPTTKTGNFDDGAWHFAAAVAQASGGAVYVDALSVESDSNAHTIGATYDRTTIGRFGDSTPAGNFTGDIDNPLIWTRALTADQISWVQQNKPTWHVLSTSTDANNPGTTGLICWPLDEWSGLRMSYGGDYHLTPDADALGVTFASADSEYAEVDTAAATAYPISMGCSVKTNTNANQSLMWIGDKDLIGDYTFIEILDNTAVRLGRRRDTQETSSLSVNIVDNAWHFVAGVADTGSGTIYVDNETPDTNSNTKAIAATYDRTSIGRVGRSIPFAYADCTIDNAWIYAGGTALTADQVEWLRTGGRTGGPATYRDVVESHHQDNPGVANLVAWWTLVERNPEDGATLVNVHNPGTLDLTTYQAGTAEDGPVSATGHVKNLPYAVAGTVAEQIEVEDRGTEFDGVDQRLSAASGVSVTYPFSIVGFVKCPADGGGDIVGLGTTLINSIRVGVSETTGLAQLAVRVDGGSNLVLNSTTDCRDGEYHLIVAVFNASDDREIYVDDNTAQTSASDALGIPAFTKTRIGCSASDSLFFKGIADDIMVFDSALTATNASEIYNNGAMVLAQDIKDGTVTLTGGAKPKYAWPLSKNHPSGRGEDIGTTGGITLTETNGPTDAQGIPAGQVQGGLCHTWLDVSPGATTYNATQPLFASRPEVIRVDDGNGVALWFDGEDDYMQTPSLAADYSHPNDVFVVANVDVAAAQYFMGGIASDKRHSLGVDTNSTRSYCGAVYEGTALADLLPHVFLYAIDGSDTVDYVDGGDPSTPGDVGSHALSGVTIGATYLPASFFKGAMRHLVVNDGALSTAQRTEIVTNFGNQHGITTTPIEVVGTGTGTGSG